MGLDDLYSSGIGSKIDPPKMVGDPLVDREGRSVNLKPSREDIRAARNQRKIIEQIDRQIRRAARRGGAKHAMELMAQRGQIIGSKMPTSQAITNYDVTQQQDYARAADMKRKGLLAAGMVDARAYKPAEGAGATKTSDPLNIQESSDAIASQASRAVGDREWELREEAARKGHYGKQAQYDALGRTREEYDRRLEARFMVKQGVEGEFDEMVWNDDELEFKYKEYEPTYEELEYVGGTREQFNEAVAKEKERRARKKLNEENANTASFLVVKEIGNPGSVSDADIKSVGGTRKQFEEAVKKKKIEEARLRADKEKAEKETPEAIAFQKRIDEKRKELALDSQYADKLSDEEIGKLIKKLDERSDERKAIAQADKDIKEFNQQIYDEIDAEEAEAKRISDEEFAAKIEREREERRKASEENLKRISEQTETRLRDIRVNYAADKAIRDIERALLDEDYENLKSAKAYNDGVRYDPLKNIVPQSDNVLLKEGKNIATAALAHYSGKFTKPSIINRSSANTVRVFDPYMDEEKRNRVLGIDKMNFEGLSEDEIVAKIQNRVKAINNKAQAVFSEYVGERPKDYTMIDRGKSPNRGKEKKVDRSWDRQKREQKLQDFLRKLNEPISKSTKNPRGETAGIMAKNKRNEFTDKMINAGVDISHLITDPDWKASYEAKLGRIKKENNRSEKIQNAANEVASALRGE